MRDEKATFFANGSPVTSGFCTVCGNKLFKMGRTEAHASLTPPVVVRVPRVAKPAGEPKIRKVAKVSAGGSETSATIKKPSGSRPAANRVQTRTGVPLVIVESPTKARTIGKFLGKGFNVRPSVGHIRDLPKNRLGVDIDNDFAPTYVIPMAKKKTVKELQLVARDAREIWLATDPDREGEAISWHLQHALNKEIEGKPIRRVEFHEITPHAIDEAFKHPRDVDINLVNSQQARRILDRLVGYTLSPLLREKMGRKGLSAGRVQSVALRLVCERERDILAFIPVEYWSLEAELAKILAEQGVAETLGASAKAKGVNSFIAKLHKVRGQDPDLKNETDATGIVRALEGSSYQVLKVDRKERQRKPAAPFTTSTLQQEASRKLGFNARRTMSAAQQLYEGMDVGEGTIGLITYMRTDSVNVATSAQAEARVFIAERYGESFLPVESPTYVTRSKNAQEAHEAIRPTSVLRTPESLKQYLDKDQLRTYDLIWKRFVASQMDNAIFDVTVVDVEAIPDSHAAASGTDQATMALTSGSEYLFRASGSIIKFAGFLKVYEEGHDEGDESVEDASDKRLPELAFGEPLDLLRLLPGQHFTQPPPRYTEASLIRRLEEEGIGRPSTYASIMTVIQSRDYVYREGKQLRPTELGFQVNDMLVGNFARYIDVGFTAHVEEDLDRIETAQREWVPVLHEFFDPFRDAVKIAGVTIVPIERKIELVGRTCPTCGEGQLIYRQSRFGKFIGCNRFPKCRHTEQIGLPGVCCPKDGGMLVEKRMKKGKRVFYGCANYPACDFTTWNKPLANVKCPNGDGGLMVEAGKGRAKCLVCETVIDLPDTAD